MVQFLESLPASQMQPSSYLVKAMNMFLVAQHKQIIAGRTILTQTHAADSLKAVILLLQVRRLWSKTLNTVLVALLSSSISLSKHDLFTLIQSPHIRQVGIEPSVGRDVVSRLIQEVRLEHSRLYLVQQLHIQLILVYLFAKIPWCPSEYLLQGVVIVHVGLF